MKKKVKERGLLGTVLHIVDKKLIVRSGKLKVKKVINSIAVTEDKREIGKVYDIFGPVNRPYVGIRVFEGLKEGELKKLAHKKLYIL
ncbi:H/ACA RNA-protein complex protein Gar1 [ANME-1 cluster archaeon GoMg4]|nr:H/ACA RNA-protein complex protein Gar1 [ANME-1 cluster archaeon GoMg4]